MEKRFIINYYDCDGNFNCEVVMAHDLLKAVNLFLDNHENDEEKLTITSANQCC